MNLRRLTQRVVVDLAARIDASTHRGAERGMHPGRPAELLCQLQESVMDTQASARLTYLRFHHAADGEMLQKRHDVGERFVEGKLIRIGGIVEVAVNAIEDGMR